MKTRLIQEKINEIEYYRGIICKSIVMFRNGWMQKHDLQDLIKTYRLAQRECWEGIKKLKE